MITKLLKRRKLIAASMLGIFYINLVLPNIIYAANTRERFFHYYASSPNRYNERKKTLRTNADGYMYNPGKPAAEIPEMPAVEDIGGPGQPEMSSFSSVNASNMVDLFTGDFSYNIPLMDVGGYPVNIHYSSGISMDQEASWVGLGWNVNPGTIGRTMRGLPDDFNGKDTITRTQNIKANKTVGANLGANVELAGLPLTVGGHIGVFHNTYNGWGMEHGINASVSVGNKDDSHLTASLGLSNNSQTGLDVSPSLSLKLGAEDSKMNGNVTVGSSYNTRAGISGLQLHTEVRNNIKAYSQELEMDLVKTSGSFSTSGGIGSFISFATPSYLPSITMPLTTNNFIFKAQVGGEVWTVHANGYLEGYSSRQYIRKEDRIQKIPAYGYLNFSKAKEAKVLLDFNREKDIAFNAKSSPHIAIPQYSYDIYTISGEGTGGMFRPYRGDVGYIHDHYVKTRNEKKNASAEIGFGGGVHIGLDYTPIHTSTATEAWKNQNDLLKNIGFAKSDSTFEEVYFRNPGEKAINTSSFYTRLGGDSLIRVKLGGNIESVRATSSFTKFSQARPAGDIAVTTPLVKSQRDKRSQVITYLNARDASLYGLDRVIKSYDTASNPVVDCDTSYRFLNRIDGLVRKEHHLSEMKVLNGDGRIYVYGLPVYNVEQEDVTFAVAKETENDNLNKGLVEYESGDNSTENSKGKDSYFNKDSTPAYAHSYLLTGLLSPDYVDVKEDGITDDDLGDAVKFNYTQLYGAHNGYYGWRTPVESNKANYNEGLKTYSRDDKGTYMYGRKEVWYLHSLESKAMIALFKTSDRSDGYSVLNENGSKELTKPLKRLDSIELYTKADLAKNGSSARPVKTVHFEYSYELCQNATGEGTSGKLTLKKIWFTYNGNRKGKLNPYQFYYHPDAGNNNLPTSTSNPSYNAKMYDRWGNYKDPSANPGGLNNLDYPYTNQDSAQSANYAQAWHMTDIKLPSGGRMHMTYEADDYAYVQDKRATQFFTIAGFGNSASATPQNILYNQGSDNYYVFVDVTSPVSSKADIYNKYLEGIEKLYFKIAVKMPSDQWGSGYEFVPTYGEIENYNTVPGNSSRFWIQLKPTDGGSPIAKAAIQFLRLNIPSKAYPTSEIGDDVDAEAVVKMLGSSFSEIKNSVEGFYNAAKGRNWCQQTQAGISFIRMNSPEYKKYGGGIRVKKVEVYDNWTKMTARSGSAGLKESVYGQEYTYTTIKEINGKKIAISSGVASYEPMIGGEENPFRTPIEYTEKIAPLAPANYMYTETPMCESFFPSAMVGYGKVRVRTINKKTKSANGWEEIEFFTTKDFPTRTEFTPLDGDSKKRYNPKLRNLLKVDAKHYLTLSQGFKIELNDMNGKLKSQAYYAENDSVNAMHYTENFYKTENSQAYQKKLNNTVWTIDSANGRINTQAEIGREVEVMLDVRQQESTTNSPNTFPNVDIVFPFLPPFVPFLIVPTLYNFPQKEQDRFRSVALMKVVQRYGILDSVVVRDKGSVVSTKNLVYDGESGNVLVTRTNNEFKDPVYSLNYPAHWAYTGMGMAYKNIEAIYNEKKIVEGRISEANDSPFPAEKHFESGDEIIATGEIGTTITGGDGCPDVSFGDTTTTRIWAIDASKTKEKGTGIYFIDSLGRPYSGNKLTLRILRSGKRNFTDASLGGFTSLANPVRETSAGEFRIVIDSATKVINTTAASFKDLWKVDNSRYEVDSCVTKTTTRSITALRPSNTMTLLLADPVNVDYYLFLQNKIVASYNKVRGTSEDAMTRALLKFNLSSIPANATITSAKINLYGQEPGDIWGHDPWNTNTMDYSYDGVRESFEGQLYKYPYSWNGTSQPPIAEWYHDYTSPVVPKAALPYQGEVTECIDYTNIECGNVIQSLVGQPSNMQNLVLKINNEFNTGSNVEIRFMSFCGDPTSNNIKNFSSEGCTDCYPVTLDVNYSFEEDTCYKVCRFNINDTAFNPYRWGILGNWRPDRAYTFYHERQEADASNPETDIRREGLLKDFQYYWQFTDSVVAPTIDSTKWVWNSAGSQYNRRGLETENYDPLGRYNSGLYGYNQTMPVAVAQNSRYRELLFDGFEDYDYKPQACNAPCQSPREIDFLRNNSNAAINNVISHSGRHSLSVNASAEAVFTVPVSALPLDSIPAAISLEIDSTAIYTYEVDGQGTGLRGNYSCVYDVLTPSSRLDGPLNFSIGGVFLPACEGGSGSAAFYAEWTGKIQPKYTDDYTFSINTSQSGAGIILDGQNILASSSNSGNHTSSPIHLEAGHLYNIYIMYPYFEGSGAIQFRWASATYQSYEIVPGENLYPPTMVPADSAGSLHRNLLDYCISLDNVKPEKIIRETFAPIEGSKIVASTWINTNTTDCSNPAVSAVPEGEVAVSFNTGGSPVILQKTGIPIEGWQRYEAVISVPMNAVSMSITLKSATGQQTFFDDIRVHPYNSNMKSFVYDPVSLRLMAELDENNYASFYEYDDDGTLIRVKKETERGIKTIKESRSALFKEE